MIVTKPAIRYMGAKFRLAPWLLQFFPAHELYTEAFGGSAGVLLQKPRSHGEVYNDLDGEIVNFFAVLRDAQLREVLIEQLRLTPFARDEFDEAWEGDPDPVERARRLCIRAQMGFGSNGANKRSTGMRTDIRRASANAMNFWVRYPDGLAAIGSRMQGVLIENRTAIEVLQQHDSPSTLHFVDPPYVHGTRVMRSNGGYRHEMSDEDHAELLEVLLELQGMVIVSGYDSELYAGMLGEWRREETDSRIAAGRGTKLRREIAWLNPACDAALQRLPGGLWAA